jgi:hypothetical protein
MTHKSIINKIMREKTRPFFAYEFQSLIFKEIDLPSYFENCKNLASIIVENGSTVTITNLMLKRRQQLSLPEISCSSNAEVRRLAKATGLSKTLKEQT